MNWVDYVSAIGSIVTPVVVIILSYLVWNLRKKSERRNDLEDTMRNERIKIYNNILKPMYKLLMSDDAWKSDPKNKNIDKNESATKEMLTLDYREQGFKLSLLASDSVVKAYNNFMQNFYNKENKETIPENDTIETMILLGKFLLEIRKNMGNEFTKLDHWDMLEWFVKDARLFRNKYDNKQNNPTSIREKD